MSAGPYAPPGAALADQPRPPWAPWKAVLLGLAIDIGGSSLVGTVISVVGAVYLASTGVKPEDLTAALIAWIRDPWVLTVGFIPGAACSFFAGMLCTRFARRSDYKLGIVLGGLSSTVGFLLSLGTYTLLVNLVLTALSFASVLVGTRFGFPRMEKQTAP
jgi:MFS family permease